MAQDDTLSLLVREIGRALLPLREAISSVERVQGLMLDLGWTVDDVPPPILDLLTPLDALVSAIDALVEGDPTAAEVEAARQAALAVIAAIDDLRNATFDPALAVDDFANRFPPQLIEYLLVRYLLGFHPRIELTLRVLGLIRATHVPASGNRPAHMRRELVWADFTQLVSDPFIVFERAYGWRTPQFQTNRVLDQVQDLVVGMGVPALREAMAMDAARVLENDAPVEGNAIRLRLNVPLFDQPTVAGGDVRAGLALIGLPQDGASLPGLALMPYAEGDLTRRFDITPQLSFVLDSGFDLQGGVGVKVRPNEGLEVIVGFNDPASATAAKGRLSARVEFKDPALEPIVLVGTADGARIEVKSVSGAGGLLLDAEQPPDLFAELELQEGRLVVPGGKGDGFLQKILPEDGFAVRFDLAAGLSSQRGFYFRGSSALEINVPTHLQLGPIALESVTIAVQPQADALNVSAGATIEAQLGPLLASIENVGVRAAFTFPGSGGNLGPLDVGVDFKPPSGVGLRVDAGGFKGGGFLRFEPELERYSGVLELEFQDQFTIKAIGLITTRLPNGQPGFSLLIIISAEFTPIQLGFGFKLNGVGGLLGLNRTVNVDRLVTGLRDNTLSSILFPTNIIANADRILSDLREVFPPQAGRFVFGPMAKITWGTPTLLTADLGLVLEVPEPIRLLILGVVRGILPDESAAILRLQVNFLGVIDFEQERLSFDASLFESKLLALTLTGDMAVRLYWGANANFLATVGGFHPAYQPPPMNLPALRRLTLALLDGDNPRLTLETYVAVTSNTAQFGARLELYAKAWKFNAYGFLSFDVLFQFNPFYFVADVTAMLALRVGSSSIASIKLTLTLEGPTPWKAKGDARLKLCWFLTVKVRFNKTFGEARNTTLPDLLVVPLLTQAFSAPDNWEEERPADRHRLESLREIGPSPASDIFVHPVGTLKISQKVVPLNIEVDRVGSQRPADGREFRVAGLQVGGSAVSPPPSQEQFAPAQFFDMGDDEKLGSPSFKNFDSGVRVGDADRRRTGYAAAREVKYELKYIDSHRIQRLESEGDGQFDVDVFTFNVWALQGAIAKSELSFARRRKSALAPESVGVLQEAFVVVRVSDLTPFDAGSVVTTEHAALKRREALIAANPALRGTLQVVPVFEMSV
jgi:hypothetical protein